MISAGKGGGSSPPVAINTGRVTFWYSFLNLLIGVDLQNLAKGMPVAAGFRVGGFLDMLPLNCVLRGMLVSKTSTIAAGTLTIKPYTIPSIGGAITNLSANYGTLSAGEKNKYFDTRANLSQFNLLGVRVQTSANYSAGAVNDVVVGLVVDF